MRDLSVSLFEMHVSDLFKSDKFHKTRKAHQKLHGLLDFCAHISVYGSQFRVIIFSVRFPRFMCVLIKKFKYDAVKFVLP